MRNPLAFSSLLLFLSCLTVRGEEPTQAEQLEKVAPHAAGIALVEVVDLKEIDSRPADGNLTLTITLRILRGSGVTKESVNVTLAQGGLRPAGAPKFQPRQGPVKPDTFQKGEKYWVAYCSEYEWGKYPQSVINVWPEKDAPKTLEAAAQSDYYAGQPQYDPKSGLTHSHFLIKGDPATWNVEMQRAGKVLWGQSFDGEKFEGKDKRGGGEWRLGEDKQLWADFAHSDPKGPGLFFFGETLCDLEAGNSYGVPAKPHRLIYVLDAESGETAAIWVGEIERSPRSTPTVIQVFDQKTRNVQREERFASLETGGIAAGTEKEHWLRKTVRNFDPETKKLKSEEFFRWTNGSTYVPVDKP